MAAFFVSADIYIEWSTSGKMSMNWVNKVLHKLEYYTFVNRNSPTIKNNSALLSAIEVFF